jgi:ATP-dependent DNA ligase
VSHLLGLYNKAGQLDHVGFSSGFNHEDRKKLKAIVTPFIAKNEPGTDPDAGFTGKAPGGPSRWTTPDRNTEWFPLKHKLVGEFSSTISRADGFAMGQSFCAGVRRKSRSSVE